MQVVFINACKSFEISSQMFFNVMFPFSKTKDKLVRTYSKIKIFSRAIWYGASNEQEAYLESRQTSTREYFGKIAPLQMFIWF